jgi:outer membrane protein assembly factor BamE (lipoprotein component of BamABCDE complex)
LPNSGFGRLLALALFAAAGLTAGGCATREDVRGAVIEEEKLAVLERGGLTRRQVRDLMGSPSVLSTFAGANDVWYYISSRTETFAFFEPKITQRMVVTVAFDEQDKVKDVQRIDIDAGREVDVVDRTTPTRGREFGLFEQLFGNVGRFNNRTTGQKN